MHVQLLQVCEVTKRCGNAASQLIVVQAADDPAFAQCEKPYEKFAPQHSTHERVTPQTEYQQYPR